MKRFYEKFVSKVGIVFLMALMFGVVSCGSAYAAAVGQTLITPEAQWQRYDDTNTTFGYLGTWKDIQDTNWLNNTRHTTYENNARVRFNFIGTKLRLLETNWYADVKFKISIDGVVEDYSLVTSSSVDKGRCIYEKTNLSYKEHYVEISTIDIKSQYFSFDAIDIDENGELKSYNENPINNTNKVVLNIEPEKNKIKKNETVSANLTIDNITDIAAEDVRIKYDAEKLEFVNSVEVEGIKLVKDDKKPGELRFILASKGQANIANAKKILLKLNFKGIKAGEALVDVVKGKVSDGITIEKDLTDADCGQATIIIEDTAFKDVNNTGAFTLLDLAIDGRHLGEVVTTLPDYNTDIIVNSAIDDADLLEIGNQMLSNPNYKF